jgi:hypothetical protein
MPSIGQLDVWGRLYIGTIEVVRYRHGTQLWGGPISPKKRDFKQHGNIDAARVINRPSVVWMDVHDEEVFKQTFE